MSYLDPIQDADHHGEREAEYTAAINAAEARISNEITECLTVTVTKVNYKFLSLPYVSYADDQKIKTQPLAEVVADEVQGGKTLDALMAVISDSTCPLVAQLRKAIAARYVYSNVGDIAQASV